MIGCRSVTQLTTAKSWADFNFFQAAKAAKTDGPHSSEWENLCFHWITWFGLKTANGFKQRWGESGDHFHICINIKGKEKENVKD